MLRNDDTIQIRKTTGGNSPVDVVPDGTDTISLVNSAVTIATTVSKTFLCYATGKWAIV